MTAARQRSMATGGISAVTFRIEPGLKEGLRIATDREHRSIANMVEVLSGTIADAGALP